MIDRQGNCSDCGGTHFGAAGKCPYLCSRCGVKTGRCHETDCPRNERWRSELAGASKPAKDVQR